MRKLLALGAVFGATMLGIASPAQANPWDPPTYSFTCAPGTGGAVFTYSYDAYTVTVGNKTRSFPAYSYTFTVPGIACPF